MRKKILIVAKTYPCPSTKYGELVCTAGIDETGKWHRLRFFVRKCFILFTILFLF
jgi:hypothetical protein